MSENIESIDPAKIARGEFAQLLSMVDLPKDMRDFRRFMIMAFMMGQTASEGDLETQTGEWL